MVAVGPFNKYLKQFKAGGAHIRRYQKLSKLKEYFILWWNQTATIINHEYAAAFNWARICGPVFRKWGSWATWEARSKRVELMIMENKASFDKRMEEAEKLAIELKKVEDEKKKLEEEAEAKRAEVEKKERLELARSRAQAERVAEKKLLLQVQRDARRMRVEKQMKKMKKKFNDKWVTKREELLEKAKARIEEFLSAEENKIAIIMKFEKLKRYLLNLLISQFRTN